LSGERFTTISSPAVVMSNTLFPAKRIDAWSAARPSVIHLTAPLAASIATTCPFFFAESP